MRVKELVCAHRGGLSRDSEVLEGITDVFTEEVVKKISAMLPRVCQYQQDMPAQMISTSAETVRTEVVSLLRAGVVEAGSNA